MKDVTVPSSIATGLQEAGVKQLRFIEHRGACIDRIQHVDAETAKLTHQNAGQVAQQDS